MALKKITNYPAKSQAFTASDLFDVSKFVTQTSGQLRPTRYTIVTYVAGDDFSNVATVVSGTINTTGCVFDAIGTTPTDYSNGSTLSSYESQSYTYAELKAGLGLNYKKYLALVSQYGTADPIQEDLASLDTFYVDTIGGVWSRNTSGTYRYIKAGMFADPSKVDVLISRVATPNIYFSYSILDDDTLQITSGTQALFTSGVQVLGDDLLAQTRIEITVYG